MKTVSELIEELSKFPDDAVCYAYEGEVTGIVVETVDADGRRTGNQSVIECAE